MSSPDDRRYMESHEWHKLEDGVITIGISQFAVEELTDITYVEVSRSQGPIAKGNSIGEIESVKATSELYSGIDGEVVAVNDQVIEDPSLINQDPYEKGWIIKIRPDDASALDQLLSSSQYDAHIGG